MVLSEVALIKVVKDDGVTSNGWERLRADTQTPVAGNRRGSSWSPEPPSCTPPYSIRKRGSACSPDIWQSSSAAAALMMNGMSPAARADRSVRPRVHCETSADGSYRVCLVTWLSLGLVWSSIQAQHNQALEMQVCVFSCLVRPQPGPALLMFVWLDFTVVACVNARYWWLIGRV